MRLAGDGWRTRHTVLLRLRVDALLCEPRILAGRNPAPEDRQRSIPMRLSWMQRAPLPQKGGLLGECCRSLARSTRAGIRVR